MLLRFLKGLAGLTAVLLLALLVLAMTIGLPQPFTESIRLQIATQQMEADWSRVRLHWRGLAVDHVSVFWHPSDQLPVFQARRVYLDVNPFRGFRLQQVRLGDATLRMSATGMLRDAAADQRIEIESLQGRWEIRAPLQQMDMKGRWKQMAIQLQVLLPVADTAGRAPFDRDLVLHRIEAQAHWLPELVRQLHLLEFAPDAQLSVQLTAGDPLQASVHLSAAAFRYRGLPFDGVNASLFGRGADWQLAAAALRHEERQARITGRVQLDQRLLEGQLDANLLPLYWRNLLPSVIRAPMDQARIHAFGETIVQLQVPTTAWTEIGRVLHGALSATRLEAHGVWLEQVDLQFDRIGPQWSARHIEARVGRDPSTGTAQGNITFDLEEGTYWGRAAGRFHPHDVLPVAEYSRIAADLIAAMHFRDQMPSIQVDFSGRFPPDPNFNFAGTIAGENFVFKGSQFDRFDSFFVVTNRTMRIDPLWVTREEGEVRGRYEQDFTSRMIDVHVQSSIDPRVLARISGGVIERVLRPFRFDGAAILSLKGRIDYGTQEQTDYVAVGDVENLGWRWLEADRCRLDWIAKGDTITMTNVWMEIYGGHLAGQVVLENVGSRPVGYAGAVDVAQVQFPLLLRGARQTERDLQEGELSGRLRFSGSAEPDWRATLAGQGTVEIRNGQVFQIPLFGGLSQLLGRIYPAFGFAVQTDARAAFEIGDRLIRSEDIRIEGNLLSLWAAGTYSLDDRLDFQVRLQPLRAGRLVETVRWVTYPVSRLFQFRLTGSLSQPGWAVDVWPREWWWALEEEAE